MITSDDYIKAVAARLPRGAMRKQITMELRGTIADRLENGHSLEDVLRLLGDPRALADSYLTARTLEPATFAQRAAAKVIDVLVVILAVLPVLIVAGQTLPGEIAAFVVVGALIVGSMGFGLYTIAAEYWMAQTLGKHLLGLRTVRESGGPITFGQALVRQLPMFLQFYWIDILFALFTERNQRAFEVLSKTRVVKASSLEVEPADLAETET